MKYKGLILFMLMTLGALTGQGVKAQTCALNASLANVCLGNTVVFTVSSSGGTVSSVSINYGDGNTSTSAVSVYAYLAAGTYTPTATVNFTGGGSCTATGAAITVYPLPVANYVITSPDTLCFRGNNLCIKNLSAPGPSGSPINQLVWQLSNGYINTVVNPASGASYCYANTTDVLGHLYSMKVEVRDANGCISYLEKKDSVLLLPKIADPSFSMVKTVYCDSTKVVFTNTTGIAQSHISSFRWVFGDGQVDSTHWTGTTHTYHGAGLYNVSLDYFYEGTCHDGIPDVVIVSTMDTFFRATGSSNCYRGNKFTFTNNTQGNVKWTIINASGSKIDSLSANQWVDYSFPTCGLFTVRLNVEMGTCNYQRDTLIPIYGPQAIIQTDTAKVVNGHQCHITDTVYFKTPVPYYSCHYNNPNMQRYWNFDDAFAPPCTTDTKNGINVGMNCNWSVDSMQVKHYYTPGQERCYQPTLYMIDPVQNCVSTDTVKLSFSQPDAHPDPTATPPRRGLYFNGHPCLSSLIKFNLDEILPICGYDRIWLNFDSACGANNWSMMDTVKVLRYQYYVYNKTCDTSGWVTVGLIVKNGNCYDTAWYHHMMRMYPKSAIFKAQLSNAASCAPYHVTLSALDSTQEHLVRARWRVYTCTSCALGLTNFEDSVSQRFDTLNPADTIIHSVSFWLPRSGIYTSSLQLMNADSCFDYFEYPVAVGYYRDFTASQQTTCTNKSFQLNALVRYFDEAGANYLSASAQWNDPARAAAGKERLWWDVGDGKGFFYTSPSQDITYTRPGNYTIRLLTVDSAGCYDTLVRKDYIKVVELKARIASLPSVFFCAPQILQFKDSSTLADSSALLGDPPYDRIISWMWDFGDNKPPSLLTDAAHNFTSNGIFDVKLIVGTDVSGCFDTAHVMIDMKGPQPDFNILSDTIGCAPFSVHFDNTTPKHLLSWTWYFGDNTVLPTVNDSDVIHTYKDPGIYHVRLQGVDTVFNTTTGSYITCSAFFPDTLVNIPSRTVYVNPMGVSALIGPDSLCPGATGIFKAAADTLYHSFRWDFGDGRRDSTQRPDTLVRHRFIQPGIYRVRLAPVPGVPQACIDTSYKTVVVDSVKADFDINKSGAPLYSFINKSSHAVRYEWTFGEPSSTTNTSTATNPSHTFSPKGLDTFMVCLRAYSVTDCYDSLCKPVVLAANLKIPNVFTPGNNDGFNDAFDILIEGWTEYDLTIYNRWGNKVFHGDVDGHANDGINWNGKIDNNGAECANGVYYFIFNYKLVTEDSPKSVNGTITLIRDDK